MASPVQHGPLGSDLLLRGQATALPPERAWASVLFIAGRPEHSRLQAGFASGAMAAVALGDPLGSDRAARLAVAARRPPWPAIDGMLLTGAGMHWVPFRTGVEEGLAITPGNAARDAGALERWSRTIGALGSEAGWHRLRQLSTAVVGCGRSGSLLARNLASLGVTRMPAPPSADFRNQRAGSLQYKAVGLGIGMLCTS